MEADRRKDEFLATLAHELRNPLAPIRTGLEILKSDGVSPLVAAQAHQVIGRQMRHLVRLIDDLLDVSRITANKLDLRLERVEVGEILAPGRRDLPRRDRAGPARPHAAPAAARYRRARRRHAAHADRRQPAAERLEVHAARRPHPAEGQRRRRRGRDSGARRRHRHRRGRRAAPVREVLAGGARPRRRPPRARPRPGAGPRPGVAARRRGHGAQRRARDRAANSSCACRR